MDFELMSPVAGNCETDQFIIRANEPLPILCGKTRCYFTTTFQTSSTFCSDETLDLAESFSYGGGKVCSGTTTLCVEVLSDPKG